MRFARKKEYNIPTILLKLNIVKSPNFVDKRLLILVDRFWSLSSRKNAKTPRTLLVSRALREVLHSLQFQIPNI